MFNLLNNLFGNLQAVFDVFVVVFRSFNDGLNLKKKNLLANHVD